ncbi:unnamed protein product [Closterium sp. NIES-65]|nr:unnamed protein product [Closterium sp. NIES-65]
MKARLAGSRFRSLNETLYTSDGDKAFQMFSEDPNAFAQYHEGYREQVASWPINPLHVIIDWICQRPATLTVADFGCGEAKLAASVPNKVTSSDLVAAAANVDCGEAKLAASLPNKVTSSDLVAAAANVDCGEAKLAASVPNKVTSLDLVAAAPGVIACNMAHPPLPASSVHIAVFCLSLMGPDYPSFHKPRVPPYQPHQSTLQSSASLMGPDYPSFHKPRVSIPHHPHSDVPPSPTQTPLPASSVHIAVFCLSLGPDYPSFHKPRVSIPHHPHSDMPPSPTQTPLPASSVHIAVFCLSLGPDYPSFHKPRVSIPHHPHSDVPPSPTQTPLPASSVHIAVFCLSHMGAGRLPLLPASHTP